ncbi:MAG: DNA polymerase III subunit chi [Geminicoccaceae bacterium]
MACHVGFYHLTRFPLEDALPRLLERVLQAGHRAVVRASSADRVEALTHRLWTYRRDSFLPHGSAADGNAALQPIWLTDLAETPNGADVLVLVDGQQAADIAAFARCLDLFDGNDAAALEAARQRWKGCKTAGLALTYWQQTEQGGWQRAADVEAAPA